MSLHLETHLELVAELRAELVAATRAAGGSLLAQEVCAHLERAVGVARHLEEHGREWERHADGLAQMLAEVTAWRDD